MNLTFVDRGSIMVLVTGTVTYEVVDAPKHAAMISFDCAECGHPELGRPVFLKADGGPSFAVGSGCASKLTGLPVAKFEADLAEARLHELIAEFPCRARLVFSEFRMFMPGRVTPKFLAETKARVYGSSTELVDEVAAIYKSLKRVGPARVAEVKFV